MFTTTRASGPETRKGRSGKSDPITSFVINSADEYSLTARRAQRLADRFGLTEHRARVVAELCWETARG